MACGRMPPTIIAIPDGSWCGHSAFFGPSTFFLNSKLGQFEDYLMQDVWGFLQANYPIRPEREAHALMGASMGGFGAYNLGIKYRERFKIVVGFFPAGFAGIGVLLRRRRRAKEPEPEPASEKVGAH